MRMAEYLIRLHSAKFPFFDGSSPFRKKRRKIMPTQMLAARRGIITPEMNHVAQSEFVSAELVRDLR